MTVQLNIKRGSQPINGGPEEFVSNLCLCGGGGKITKRVIFFKGEALSGYIDLVWVIDVFVTTFLSHVV